MRHSAYKRGKYTFFCANIQVINTIMKIKRENKQTLKCITIHEHFHHTVWNSLTFLDGVSVGKTNIIRIVQTIQRSLHSRYKHRFSARSHGRARQGERAYRQVCGQRGRNLTVAMSISPINGLVFSPLLLAEWMPRVSIISWHGRGQIWIQKSLLSLYITEHRPTETLPFPPQTRSWQCFLPIVLF